MIAPTHESYVQFRQLSSGQSLRALAQVQKILASRSEPTLQAAVERAMTSAQRLVDLEQQLESKKAGGVARYTEHVRELDAAIDRQLSALETVLQGLRASAAPDSEASLACQTIHRAIFPAGVGAIVKARIPDQHAAVLRIVELLQGKLASELSKAAIPLAMVERITALSQQLHHELGKEAQVGITYADVRAQAMLVRADILRVIVAIFARYPDDSAEHLAARGEVLLPLAVAAEDQRLHRRNRYATLPRDPDDETAEA